MFKMYYEYKTNIILNSKRDVKLCQKIIDLMDRINLIIPESYNFEIQFKYYLAISNYYQFHNKYKSGHKYGELKDGT